MNKEERQQIRRTRKYEYRKIASGYLQKEASQGGNEHAADCTAKAAYANDGSHRPTGEHVGRNGKQIR